MRATDAFRDEVEEPVERGEVGAEVAVGVRDDGAARSPRTVSPVRRSVVPPVGRRRRAGSPSRSCGRASRRPRARTPGASTTVPSSRPSAPTRQAGSTARTPQPARRANAAAPALWSRCRWVSSTPRRRPPATSSTRSRCPSSSGPGRRPRPAREPGRRATQVLVPLSVIGPGLGASTDVRVGPNRVTGPSTPFTRRRRSRSAAVRPGRRSGGCAPRRRPRPRPASRAGAR